VSEVGVYSSSKPRRAFAVGRTIAWCVTIIVLAVFVLAAGVTVYMFHEFSQVLPTLLH
jgi:hypothetical protein